MSADDTPDGMYGRTPPPGYESRASRRAMDKAKIKEAREKKIASLEAQIAYLRQPPAGCEFCADLPAGSAVLKHECGDKYGLKIDGDIVTCPKCDRVMAHWE